MPEVVVDNAPFGEWTRELLRHPPRAGQAHGALIGCRENVYLVLMHHPAWRERIAWDAFAQRIVLLSDPGIADMPAGPWSENHSLVLGLWLAQQLQLRLADVDSLRLGVAMAAMRREVHPVREYLQGLVWDGTPRLAHWLTDFLGVQRSEYASLVGAFFLRSMVARVMQPGCICRSVPVLEGRQGRGKSTALRILASPWFADTHLDPQGRDAFLQVQGAWLYEVQEMSSFSLRDASVVKQFVSSRVDKFRPPYGRGVIEVDRQVVFAGSTNEMRSGYLRDWTGNTRYWPIECEAEGPIELDALASVRDQLFAEALADYHAGKPRHPSRDEEARLFTPQQEEREALDPWMHELAARLQEPEMRGRETVTARELLADHLGIERGKRTLADEQRVGRVMAKLGWTRKRGSGAGREWYYQRPSPVTVPEAVQGQEGGDDVPL